MTVSANADTTVHMLRMESMLLLLELLVMLERSRCTLAILRAALPELLKLRLEDCSTRSYVRRRWNRE